MSTKTTERRLPSLVISFHVDYNTGRAFLHKGYVRRRASAGVPDSKQKNFDILSGQGSWQKVVEDHLDLINTPEACAARVALGPRKK
jgi:hypothetical protein